jgi:hypothetical protein
MMGVNTRMLPLPAPVLNGVEVTHDEHRACLGERRRFLQEFAQAEGLVFPYEKAAWERLGARWEVLERDRDGALLVIFTAHGYSTGLKRKYIRRVRLVKTRHLRLA